MRQIIFILTLFALNLTLLGQDNLPKDYYDPAVQNGQRNTAKQFQILLEQNKPDSALLLVDKSFLDANPDCVSELKKAAKFLSTIHSKCLPRGNPITFDKDVNIIKSTYTIPSTPQFAMLLSFRQGDKNSRIINIKFKDKKQLESEKKKSEEKDSGTPPPSPKTK